jgi:hypothetical protein
MCDRALSPDESASSLASAPVSGKCQGQFVEDPVVIVDSYSQSDKLNQYKIRSWFNVII